LTDELLNSVTTDSESKTFYYVFSVSNTPTVSLNTRKWSSSFSKYLVTEGFKEVLTDYKMGYEKHINYLKQTNREQYALMLSIHGVDSREKIRDKNSIKHSKDDKEFQKELETDVLEDGKKFLQRALKEKDEYLEAALKDKDKVISDMQNSFAFRTLSKLDKLLGRKHKKK